MTKAYDIYKRALSLMFEEEGDDGAFYDMFPHVLNMLLCEALPYENSVRESRGERKIERMQQISSMDDKVDMCDEICHIALPYGVASYFSKDDGEASDAFMYRERFISALNEAAKYRFCEVIDVYGGDIE